MGEPAPAPAPAPATPPESAPPEALLVMLTREPGRPDEASFLRVSSSSPSKPAPMPHRVTIPSGYSLSNVCNGLLCFALVRDNAEAPAFICNPVTGETAMVHKAPPPIGFTGGTIYHLFALGFSPSTKEHKLFRFTFSPFSSIHGKNIDLCVRTLDGAAAGGGGWRQSSFHSQCPLLPTLLPVLVHGKLYLVTTGRTGPGKSRNPDGLLEVDVATEARCTHRLPFEADEYHPAWDPLVNACEMDGRLCLAVDILRGIETTARKIQFWVLMSSSSPPNHHQDQQLESDNLRWDLRYSFHVDGDYYFVQPRSVWFDDGEMTLCYRDYKVMFKHSTRGRSPESSPDADCPQCDRQIQLPPTPSNCQWNISGGYRSSLLSPLTLAPPPSCWDGEEERQKFEHDLLLALN